MRASHGWAEVDRERKREILQAIATGGVTRGPAHAELDLTDRCNVACYFCNQQDVRTKEQISLPHLRALIDELAAGGLKSVRLSGGGDPLAHRDVGEVLDHLHARGIVVDNLTTNGALLTPAIARRLADRGAREVIFSLNAVDRADYARMMQTRPEVFDRVGEAVTGLRAARGAGGRPALVIQFLLDRVNYPRLPEMYDLGVSFGADRIAVGLVLNIPLARIDPAVLLHGVNEDAERLRPGLEAVLAKDRDRGLLQIDFPVPSWNVMLREIKSQLSYPEPAPLFSTAPAFREENGHCFFGWYTATIRGNGDLYPCCLLMTPDYKPLGNVLDGQSFAQHWNGTAFGRLREEMRDVFVRPDLPTFQPSRYQLLRRQCVEPGLCWLKNIYFRGDQEFYAELGAALDGARRRARALEPPHWVPGPLKGMAKRVVRWLASESRETVDGRR